MTKHVGFVFVVFAGGVARHPAMSGDFLDCLIGIAMRLAAEISSIFGLDNMSTDFLLILGCS